MAQLEIKGHETRGSEVIALLEMLGGINSHNLYGDESYAYYTIDSDKEIKGRPYMFGDEDLLSFTLEQFEEKFPYKVGDKVKVKETKKEVTIEGMSWRNGCEVIYDTCYNNDCVSFYSAEELQPYKEETMEEQITIEDITLEKAFMCTFLEMVEGKQRLRIALNEGFELKEENGNFFVCRKKVEYPKTYEECCEVLLLKPERATYSASGLEYKRHLIVNLQRLLICRDAYWKIYGERMGLGKPWNQDYNDRCFVTANNNGNIHTYEYHGSNNVILAFPTKEMRDAFYENFKVLIDQCKELL